MQAPTALLLVSIDLPVPVFGIVGHIVDGFCLRRQGLHGTCILNMVWYIDPVKGFRDRTEGKVNSQAAHPNNGLAI
ncbi:hypothetical protein ANO14919_036550 [Xylariales sp. No.14919]|nr:hypothetical protein F5X98DRAFT_328570 [Xylaria grammica]GAW14255.1 hypothetical protein ANO14919_036550 [Xylariales sp. No.14919]